ncbi:MAG: hypothetical protein IJ593_11020 [Lachnospiraceae bacterium]|nr:hypothetical protein [Lachnospiraceae bacterium]
MNKNDNCVICRKETTYAPEDTIEQRECYVEGCGQLCYDCYNKIFRKRKTNYTRVNQSVT